ncbi:MAG: hypothetical protein AUJ20_12460 [Comamonadaceae bacterium CG1_02_60_18]|nr:MAG: hypothetical protein AUJ20_12460 [Comamonadaceae bacterium CG1_02_60_18]PIQ50696.1 MAG: hypothetical protein COW02_18965 [Comamonadaceae bacterium CG12_big_fil_rev_8_21_14_0_65_59_15]
MIPFTRHWALALGTAAALLSVAACGSLKTPATADVAVSKAAVDNAAGAGGADYAPVEMLAARQKMALANQAMASKDYKQALTLAAAAQADAKLAQSKANSAKAQIAADALQDDIRVLREELERNN